MRSPLLPGLAVAIVQLHQVSPSPSVPQTSLYAAKLSTDTYELETVRTGIERQGLPFTEYSELKPRPQLQEPRVILRGHLAEGGARQARRDGSQARTVEQ